MPNFADWHEGAAKRADAGISVPSAEHCEANRRKWTAAAAAVDGFGPGPGAHGKEVRFQPY